MYIHLKRDKDFLKNNMLDVIYWWYNKRKKNWSVFFVTKIWRVL